jgi:hypothetical protein
LKAAVLVAWVAAVAALVVLGVRSGAICLRLKVRPTPSTTFVGFPKTRLTLKVAQKALRMRRNNEQLTEPLFVPLA